VIQDSRFPRSNTNLLAFRVPCDHSPVSRASVAFGTQLLGRKMSAYGAMGSRGHKSESPLPTTRWTTRDKATRLPISIHMHHFTLETASKSPGLVEYLHSVFARVVEDGRTYPMEVAEGETYSRQAFESYFFAASGDGPSVDSQNGVEVVSGTDSRLGPQPGPSKHGQPPVWEDIIVGFYYVGFSISLRADKDDCQCLDDAHRSNLITQADPRMCVIFLSWFRQFHTNASCWTLSLRRFATRGSSYLKTIGTMATVAFSRNRSSTTVPNSGTQGACSTSST